MGHNLLVIGLRWRAGSSTSIRVFSNMWLPQPHSFKHVAHLAVDVNLVVKDLLLPNGESLDCFPPF